MNASTKHVKSQVAGKPLHELTPQLLLAILDTLVDISDKLDLQSSLKDNGLKRK